ncbi:MAG: ATP-binding cassette domain-containing protein [Chitinophagaceae bacterium]|nr:MAG: ATP-binding cassette domain-containing protein [Chitinophagaceae bacterium]
MIEILNIHKSFNGKKILNGITGTFEPGKCNLLLGASGTGKSVLLKCIVGLVKPDIGNITYDGRVFSNNRLELKQEINRLSEVIAKLDDVYAQKLNRSLQRYADHVKRSTHSVFQDFIFPLHISGLND